MKTKEELKQYLKEWRTKNKDKWNAYGAKWYANNKQRRLAVGKEWDEHNKERRREISREYKERNRERIAEEQRLRLLKYKTLVVEAYGGCCACCGEKHIGVLTVEHINKNGKQHRREIGGNLYYQLVKNNFPKDAGLSILCMNCNWIERHGDLCHHKTEKSA